MAPNFIELEAQIRAYPESDAQKMCWKLLGGYQECARQRDSLEAIVCKKQ
jgi:hypothetical protein